MKIDEISIDQEENQAIQNTKSKLIEKKEIFYKEIRNREKIIISQELIEKK